MAESKIDGRYEIRQKLGQGAMGVVYKVQDPQTKRTLALKVLSQAALEEDGTSRFQREFHAIRRLQHPNIVKVYDLHRNYFTMEYVEGSPLAPAEVQDFSALVNLTVEICRALRYIHAQGMVHGDLKPAHILVAKGGRGVKLIDFGMAREVDLHSGALQGTLDYLAPEQARGLAADPRSDLYSLGVILYECSTRRLPFEAEDPVDLIMKHVSAPPVAPREIERKIPKALEAVILKLLEKDPAQRIQSAEELMDRLAALGAQREIRAGRVETGSHLLYPPRLVGRDELLGELVNALGRAETGAAQQVLLWGGFGMGKSRLLAEFRAVQFLRKTVLLNASAPGNGTRNYPPLATLLEQICFLLEREMGPEDLTAFAERYGSTLLRFAPDLAEKAWLSSVKPRHLLDLRRPVRDLAEIIKLLADRTGRSVAVLVDDAERTEAAQLQVLAALAATARRVPLLVLLAADEPASKRSTTSPLLEEFALAEGAVTLSLPPLSAQQVSAFAASMIGKPAVEDGFASRLAALSKGCPQVVEELMKSLADRGEIFKQGGRWQSRVTDLSGLALPKGHEERLLAKAQELPAEARKVLAAAALIRRGITSGLLSEVTKMDIASLFEILSDLVRQGFLAEARERRIRVYSLSAEKASAWALEQTPARQRSQAHDAVASVLEEDRPEAFAEDLGFHLSRGRTPHRAAPHLRRAGDQAAEALDFRRAAEHYRAALETGGEELAHEEKAVLGIRLGRALLALGQAAETEEAEQVLADAVAVARRGGQSARGLLAGALAGYTAALVRRRAFAEAEASAREWSAAAGEAGEMPSLVEAQTALGDAQRLSGDREAAVASYTKAMAVAEKVASGPLLARAALGRGQAALALGRLEEAREVLARAAEALRQDDPAGLLPEVLLFTGEARLLSGEPEEAAVLVRRLASAEPQLERPVRARYHRVACLTALAQWEFGSAQRHFRAALRFWEALGDEGAMAELALRYTEAASLASRDSVSRLRAEAPHLLKEAQERFMRWGQPKEAERVQQAAERSTEAFSGSAQSIKVERDNLVFLQEVLRAMNSELDLDRLLSLVMDMVIDILQAERGFLMLLDDVDRISFAVARNIDKEIISKPEFKVSNTIAKRVIETGKAILTQDAQADDRFKKRLSVSNLKLRSVLCVPLRQRDRVLGVVYVDNRFVSERFHEDNLKLLTAFADQAGIAIENARLVGEIRGQKAALEKANGEIQVLNRQLEGKVASQRAELEEAKSALSRRKEGGQEGEGRRYSALVGQGAAMQEIYRLLDRVVPTGVPVLVEGESGTGKELVARAIHFHGPRKTQNFVSENCAAVTPTLLESELFGYVKGAFTGADGDKPGLFDAAHGGTLFLDELGEMPLDMQSKFLRALENGEVRPVGSQASHRVDVRIVAATNRSLEALVKEGKFREDLYYRLNVVRIQLPPLRDRREDIPALVSSFLDEFAQRSEELIPRRMEPDALALVAQQDWPGNVRELKHFLERLLLLSPEGVVRAADVREQLKAPSAGATPVYGSALYKLSRREVLDRFDRDFVEKTLARHAGNVSAAASESGIERQYLHKIMKRFGMKGQDFRPVEGAAPAAGGIG